MRAGAAGEGCMSWCLWRVGAGETLPNPSIAKLTLVLPPHSTIGPLVPGTNYCGAQGDGENPHCVHGNELAQDFTRGGFTTLYIVRDGMGWDGMAARPSWQALHSLINYDMLCYVMLNHTKPN